MAAFHRGFVQGAISKVLGHELPVASRALELLVIILGLVGFILIVFGFVKIPLLFGLVLCYFLLVFLDFPIKS